MVKVEYKENEIMRMGLLYKIVPFLYISNGEARTLMMGIVIDIETSKFKEVAVTNLVYYEPIK